MNTSTVKTKNAHARANELIKRSPTLEKKFTIQVAIAPLAKTIFLSQYHLLDEAPGNTQFAFSDSIQLKPSQREEALYPVFYLEGEEHTDGQFAVLNRFFFNWFTGNLVEQHIRYF